MKKCAFIFLLLLAFTTVWGQQKTQVIGRKKPAAKAEQPKKTSLVDLISSTSSDKVPMPDGKTLLKVYKGTFKQDYSTLTSDSAYFYPDQNMVDAFGHVVIVQGDTLHIYSDKLNYNGNTKIAILTDHVKMVDKDAILTTDHLTYNTATRIATYTDGGKLVNKDNTLVSKNGYYFSFTHDSYFRYNVVSTTPDAVIKTDTLRYNTESKMSYFYGPTHIFGKKDKDTLYTENGTYNGKTEQARFWKNNRYSQGSKSLVGDSLFYDRLKGYGRAVKHVTFADTEQKITMKGGLGEYYKDDDRAVITQHPYMILVTEEKDSTKTDSLPKAKPQADRATIKKLGLPITQKQTTDPVTLQRLGLGATAKDKTDSTAVKPAAKTKETGKTAATIKQSTTSAKGKGGTIAKTKDSLNVKPPVATKKDSVYIGGDTLETRILTYKEFKEQRKMMFDISHEDSTARRIRAAKATVAKNSKYPVAVFAGLPQDSDKRHVYFFGRPKPKAAPVKKPLSPAVIKRMHDDSVKKVRVADSLQKVADHGLVDTSRIRVLSAHHHAKLFKSDLQAKSDSMYYSYSDSTIRMYVNPMIWTQNSQLSGDTINLQMKNKALDNMDMFPKAFIVNIDKTDSTHFNQVSGKLIHSTFRDNKLSTMAVFGNAETIYFRRDSATNKVKDLNRTQSSRARVVFRNGEVVIGALVSKTTSQADPIKDVKEEEKLLKGFIWKPKERPVSKWDIIGIDKPAGAKPPVKHEPVKGAVPVKAPPKGKANDKKKAAIVKPPTIKKVKDTLVKAKVDTVKK